MTFKRRALGVLTRNELLDLGRSFELAVSTGMRQDELADVLSRSKRAGLDKILPLLARDTLKGICEELGLPSDGREKQVIVDRIVAARPGAGNGDDEEATPPPAPVEPLTLTPTESAPAPPRASVGRLDQSHDPGRFAGGDELAAALRGSGRAGADDLHGNELMKVENLP